MNNNDLDIERELEKIDQEQNKKNNKSKHTMFGAVRMINCPKCGQPMKITARCCMHCGELNELNHQNDRFKKIFSFGKKLKMEELKKEAIRDEKEANSIRKTGKTIEQRKYLFTKRLGILFFLIVLVFGYMNRAIIFEEVSTFRAKSYIKQVDKIINQLDNSIKIGECGQVVGVDNIFSFEMSSDYFKTFVSLYTFDYFKGYIKVVNNGSGEYDYYITISDGKYGFYDTLYNPNMDYNTVQKLNNDIDIVSSTFTCR